MKISFLRIFICHFLFILALALVAVSCKSNDSGAGNSIINEHRPAGFNEEVIQIYNKYADDDERRQLVVALDLGYRPAGELSERETLYHQGIISATQEQVISSLTKSASGNAVLYKNIPAFAVYCTRKDLLSLANTKEVLYIYETYDFELDLSDAIPAINGELQLGNETEMRPTGKGYSVAIIDKGFDTKNPFYAERIKEEFCFSTIPDEECEPLCWQETGTMAAQFNNYSQDPAIDMNFHGSFLAGIISGYMESGINNGSPGPFHGVAPEAGLILVKCAYLRPACPDPENCDDKYRGLVINLADVLSGLDALLPMVQKRNLVSVNMSFHKETFKDFENKPLYVNQNFYSSEMFDAIANLRSLGVAVVASTGGEGFDDEIGYPANFINTTAVGSYFYPEDSDDLSAGTVMGNRSAAMDLIAPANVISSVTPDTPQQFKDEYGGHYRFRSGSSYSTAQVSAAYAVLKEAVPQANPENMLEAMKKTGLPINDTDDDGNARNFPMLQLRPAIEELEKAKNDFGSIRYNSMSAFSNEILFSWNDTRNQHSDIYAQIGYKSTDGNIFMVNESEKDNCAKSANTFLDGKNRIFVVWEQSYKEGKKTQWALKYRTIKTGELPDYGPIGTVNYNQPEGGFRRQLNPDLARLGEDKCILLYEEYDNQEDDYEIRAVVFDNGEPESLPFVISQKTGSHRNPRISASNNTEHVVAVWDTETPEGEDGLGNLDIYARIIKLDKNPGSFDESYQPVFISDPKIINYNVFPSRRYAAYPDIAVNDEGMFAVTWQDDYDNDLYADVFARILNEKGETPDLVYGSVKKVNDNRRVSRRHPKIACNSTRFVIVWQDELGEIQDGDIMGRAYYWGGGMLQLEPYHISENQIIGKQQTPEIAMRNPNADNVVIAWQDDRNQDGWTRIPYRIITFEQQKPFFYPEEYWLAEISE